MFGEAEKRDVGAEAVGERLPWLLMAPFSLPFLSLGSARHFCIFPC